MKRTEFRVSIQLPLEPFTNVAYGLCESMNDRDFAETNFKVSVIEGVQRGDIVRDEYEISADLPFDLFFILMDCLKEEVGAAGRTGRPAGRRQAQERHAGRGQPAA